MARRIVPPPQETCPFAPAAFHVPGYDLAFTKLLRTPRPYPSATVANGALLLAASYHASVLLGPLGVPLTCVLFPTCLNPNPSPVPLPLRAAFWEAASYPSPVCCLFLLSVCPSPPPWTGVSVSTAALPWPCLGGGHCASSVSCSVSTALLLLCLGHF